MVLGDANLHAVVDRGDCCNQCLGSMSNGHAISTLLQLSRRILQETSKSVEPLSAKVMRRSLCLVSMLRLFSQFWRLATTFLYFGPFSLDLLFHIYFLQRYSRLLEESSGRSPAHFSWLLLYATASLIAISPLVSMPFLGHPLSSTLVYIWSRRNPDTRLRLLGVLVFTAPYLPWVLMGFSLVMHGTVPRDEIMGVVIGHVWYFFTDVYPPLHNGSRPFDPPFWWVRLFEGRPAVDTAGGINNDMLVAGPREVGTPEIQ